MYGILQVFCVVSFLLKVPMLLVIRARSRAPWWFVIASATALGWMLSNAYWLLQPNAVRIAMSKGHASVLYGPLYLLCCSVSYWLIFGRRSARGVTLSVVLLTVAALVIEWAAIVGKGSHRGSIETLFVAADPFIWPPATVATAFVIAWIASNLMTRARRPMTQRS